VDTSKAPPELEGALVDFLKKPLRALEATLEGTVVYKLLLRFREATE
jgi:hypothetical protein